MTENEDREALITALDVAQRGIASTPMNAHALAAVAGGLLEAGFRRPRTVSAIEELDALPVNSVVLEPLFDAVMQKGSAQTWWGVARDRELDLPPSLPAVVLWEPTEEMGR